MKIHFEPDRINEQQIITLRSKDSSVKDYNIVLSVSISGFTKIIKFQYTKHSTVHQETFVHKKKEESKTEVIQNAKVINQQINVKLMCMGVSIVVNHDPKKDPFESIYFTVHNTEFIHIDNGDVRTVQLRIQYMNLDNNRQHFVQWPVVLTPQKYGLFNKPDSKLFLINAMVEQNLRASNITLFNKINLEFEPFVLRIEDSFINSMMELVEALQSAQQDGSQDDDAISDPLLSHRPTHQANQNRVFAWEQSNLPAVSSPT